MNLCVIDSCGACGVSSLDGVGWRCLQMEQIPVGPLKLHGRALWKTRYLSWLYFAGKKGSMFDLIFVGNVWRMGVALVLVGCGRVLAFHRSFLGGLTSCCVRMVLMLWLDRWYSWCVDLFMV